MPVRKIINLKQKEVTEMFNALRVIVLSCLLWQITTGKADQINCKVYQMAILLVEKIEHTTQRNAKRNREDDRKTGKN